MYVSNNSDRHAPVTLMRGLARYLCAAAAGLAAWTLLTLLTALADPRSNGAGLVSAFDSLATWLATGASLTAAAMIAHALYRRRGGRRLAIGVAIAAASGVTILALLNIGIVLQAAIAIGLLVAVAYGLRHGYAASSEDDVSGEWVYGDGFRYGYNGYGYYRRNMPYMMALELDDDDDD